MLGTIALLLLLAGPAGNAPAPPRLRGAALEKYRAPTPHPRAVSVPSALQRQLAEDPGANLKPLVEWLVHGLKDPFERARVLHDWVALTLTYDWEGFLADRVPDQSVGAVLERRTAVCAGYASLFEAVCRLAELECVTISGRARGFERPGAKRDDGQANHAWNAVKVAEAWYLLDVTWDSPEPKAPLKTSYFLIDPVLMGFQHLPTEPAWQLVAEPIDEAKFSSRPRLSAAFLELAGAPIEGIGAENDVEQEFSFFVSHPDDVSVSALVRPRGSNVLEPVEARWAGLRREQGGTRITAAAPVAGACEVLVTLRGRSRAVTEVIPFSAKSAADHGYASLSAEFVRVSGAPPGAQQLSNRVADPELTFTIPHAPGVQIVAQLESLHEADWVAVVTAETQTTISVSFPKKGQFQLNLWAKRKAVEASTVFYLDVVEASGHGYLSIDPRVLAMTGRPLGGERLSNHVKDRRLELQFRLPKGVEVAAQWSQGERNAEAQVTKDGEVTTLSFEFPEPGQYSVTIWANRVKQKAKPAHSSVVFVE